jgi:uncharacterized protein
MDLPWETLQALLAAQPEEHLFVTVSGAHLHGYPSAESDVDLRGCHRLPTDALFALERPSETVERLEVVAGCAGARSQEIETISHEVEKYLRLMLKRNGAILEQLYSPLVVLETPALAELRELARGCITRGLYHHYRSAMQSTYRAYQREGRRAVKPLLALYRLGMTGTHVLREGVVEPNLPRLNETYGLPRVAELIERKVADEAATLAEDGPYLAEVERLGEMLTEAYANSSLPEAPSDRAAIDAFLYRQRWEGLGARASGGVGESGGVTPG